jgi:hypothetical protein
VEHTIAEFGDDLPHAFEHHFVVFDDQYRLGAARHGFHARCGRQPFDRTIIASRQEQRECRADPIGSMRPKRPRH